MAVHIKEIPALRIHTKVNQGEVTYTTEMYNLLLPHLVEEFRNKDNETYVGVSCFPPFPFNDEIEEVVCNHIEENIVDSETKIFFDNVYEGHTVSCIHGIYKIIKKLNLDPSRCYFISGGMQAKSLYREYCISKNIEEKLNIIVLNSWERHINGTMERDNLRDKFQYTVANKEKLLLCFNRVLRPHRIALLGLLYEKNLVERSYYSFFNDLTHAEKITWLNFVFKNRGFFSENVFNTIVRNLKNNEKNFPLILNNDTGTNTNSIYDSDAEFYKNSYFSLVTETYFFGKFNDERWEEKSVFFSEKIFKPIACKHPFILASTAHSLRYLRDLGYQTFHPFIDESYDLIKDDESRLLAIVNEIEKLSKQTPEQWIEWMTNVKPIVEHNQTVLLNKTREEYKYIER